MTNTAKASHKDEWQSALSEQLAHWDLWLAGKLDQGPKNRLSETYRFPGDAQEALALPPGSTVRVLDLGSGPASTIGPNWPERTVLITRVDVMADEYNDLLRKHGFDSYANIVKGCGETLLDDIAQRDFDLVFCENALDHTYDPLLCLKNMLAIAKPGGWVMFRVLENEGERQKYNGLHKWNFTMRDGEFTLWDNFGAEYKLARELSGGRLHRIATLDLGKRGNQFTASIQKAQAP